MFTTTIFDRIPNTKKFKLADAIVAFAEASMPIDELQYRVDNLSKLLAAEAGKNGHRAHISACR